MSIESETTERHRNLREKFFPVTRKPITIPLPQPLVSHAARQKMTELIDRQLAAERHPVRKGGPRRLFGVHQPFDPNEPVKDLSPSEREWRQKVRDILVEAGENLARLRSNNRDRKIVQCRREISLVLRERGWSYPRIGKFMGRDHSSIISLLDGRRGQAKYAKLKASRIVDNDLIT